jgi:acyl carrier protein
LERLKVPKRILAVEKIPRGGAGKPKMSELRDLLTPLLEGNVPVTDHDMDIPISERLVYELAANVFRVSVEELDANSSPATVNGWDSFNQLNLLIEAEHRFGVYIPAAQVASIRTLGDLYQTITAKH